MSNQIIETIPGESENLALHVQLCEQRYLQLINKLDHVDGRFAVMESMLLEIKDKLTAQTTSNDKTYLRWAGSIIFVLSTTLIGLVVKLLLL
jgi:hypothetical protein